jgi:hypothetical protein
MVVSWNYVDYSIVDVVHNRRYVITNWSQEPAAPIFWNNFRRESGFPETLLLQYKG